MSIRLISALGFLGLSGNVFLLLGCAESHVRVDAWAHQQRLKAVLLVSRSTTGVGDYFATGDSAEAFRPGLYRGYPGAFREWCLYLRAKGLEGEGILAVKEKYRCFVFEIPRMDVRWREGRLLAQGGAIVSTFSFKESGIARAPTSEALPFDRCNVEVYLVAPRRAASSASVAGVRSKWGEIFALAETVRPP